jgi:hypothetical protein
MDERLASPWTKLPADRKDPALAGSAAGQLHKLNRLVQHHARLLGIALEDEGRRDIPRITDLCFSLPAPSRCAEF